MDNYCSELYTVVEPVKPQQLQGIAVQEVTEVLDDGGRISSLLPQYEKRKEQLVMAQKVANSFNDSKNLIVEAGTGTGKSLAYLIPSILWAVKK